MTRSFDSPCLSSLRNALKDVCGSAEIDLPGPVPEPADPDDYRARRRERQELVRPLHYGHATAVEHLLDAQLHQLGEALRTVGVDVVDAHAPWILVDEHEGGTRHIGVHAQPSREPLQEAG